MPQVTRINDKEIAYSERILLPVGKMFDDERRAFIRNLDTIDLQAVPGSGKTTALLAKLLILEGKLPFNDGSGILVLSHTNAAIDQIKNKIQKHCPKLFSYPNYIGTIQSFVDEFLAIPCGHNLLMTRISWVDNEKYEDKLWSKFQKIAWARKYEQPTKWFYSKYIKRAEQEAKDSKKDKEKICIELIEQEVKSLYYDYTDDTIKSSFTHEPVLKTVTNLKFVGLKKIIEEVLLSGIISYDYAYHLGRHFLQKIPSVRTLLQKRFGYVFVDEMQDMDEYQYNILESIFYDAGNSTSKYQRIGDKNQAIYNSVKLNDIWIDRNLVLPLNGSQRLSKPIADVVKPFALQRNDNFDIIGQGECQIKPHILLYTNDTLKDVIPFFGTIVKTFVKNGELPDFNRYSIKAFAWNTEWHTQTEKDDLTKIRLVDYYSRFEKDKHKPKQDYDYLKSYLIYFDREKRTLESIRKNVLNALLKVLRLEGIENESQRVYTIRTLLDYFNNKDLLEKTNYYEILKLHIYEWSIGIIRNKVDEVWNNIKTYIPIYLCIFGKKISFSSNFINTNIVEAGIREKVEQVKNSNQLKVDDLNIEITTVHSAKGQTHCATLYLESYYHQDGKGDNAKSYESQRLAEQFLGNPILNTAGQRVKESAKMAYVGFSRASNLLCVAIHQDRFKKYLSKIDRTKWEVMEVQSVH